MEGEGGTRRRAAGSPPAPPHGQSMPVGAPRVGQMSCFILSQEREAAVPICCCLVKPAGELLPREVIENELPPRDTEVCREQQKTPHASILYDTEV